MSTSSKGPALVSIRTCLAPAPARQPTPYVPGWCGKPCHQRSRGCLLIPSALMDRLCGLSDLGRHLLRRNVYESMERYTQVELLDGDDQFWAEGCGLQVKTALACSMKCSTHNLLVAGQSHADSATHSMLLSLQLAQRHQSRDSRSATRPLNPTVQPTANPNPTEFCVEYAGRSTAREVTAFAACRMQEKASSLRTSRQSCSCNSSGLSMILRGTLL